MGNFTPKLKLVSLMWLEGFREACCLNRVILCLRSRELAVRTGQCFLLNGFIFLGSIYVFRSFVIPTLQWILPDGCQLNSFQEPCPYESIPKFYPILRSKLIQLFYVLWFYPMYISSFILSMLWYGDIAKHGFLAIEMYSTSSTSTPESSSSLDSSASKSTASSNQTTEGLVVGMAEQVYSILLMNFFVLQVFFIGFIPLFGQFLSFILLTWLYAYSCFEYKWNHSGVSLDTRLNFFESNWPFFAGFGSPCVVAIFFYTPLVSYGVMAILFPLFVMTAAGSKADSAISSGRRNWRGAGLPRLPIFCIADYLSMKVLALLPTNAPPQKAKG